MTDSMTDQSSETDRVRVDPDVVLTAADHEFRLRVYRPESPGETPADAPGGTVFVWAHGGAWYGGAIDMPEADWVSRSIAGAGVTVVSVDYTLAPLPEGLPDDQSAPAADRPRAGYPVASLQLAAAYDWTVQQAVQLGGQPDRVAIGGASAGGNLAASAALRIRDAGGQQPYAMVLIYPALHAELPPAGPDLAAKLDAEIAALPPEQRIDPQAMPMIVGNYAGRAQAEPYAFPGGHDVSRLPRTLIINADLDTLRSSGEAFAAELAGTGADVRVLTERGTRHGYINDPQDPAAPVTVARMVRWLTEE